MSATVVPLPLPRRRDSDPVATQGGSILSVTPGLVPGVHRATGSTAAVVEPWVPGTSPGTTRAEFPAAATDDRYRRLLGEAAWMRLPASVRRRFSRHLAPDEQIVYRGEVVCMALSRAGWLLAQAARLTGAPLPYTRDALGPTTVVVTEQPALGGQVWARSYPRPGRFPQVIHSAKRFAGPTGLEEYLGFGLLMRLTLHEEAGQLVFRSAGFAWRIAGRTVPVPRWLAPGACTVTHRAETDGRFSFTLTLDHPWLGRLVHQVAFFDEAV